MDVEKTEELGALTPSEAADAFLSRWKVDAKEPSTDDEGAKEEEVDETDDASETEEPDATEEVEEGEEDQQEEAAEDKYVDDDNVKVKVKVGDEELVVSVKDLKRLYGQEASLTRKSQEVAQKRKEVEEQGSLHITGLQKLYERAVERYKPFANIDMLVASKQMDTEELQILRQEANKAYEDVRFMESELQVFAKTVDAQRQKMIVEQAKIAVEVLKNPETGIPNFSPETYKSILDYAVSNGMPADVAGKIVDPLIIKTIWKAMNYDNTKQVATVKKVKAPTKVLKSKSNVATSGFASDSAAKAMSTLRKTGSRDDAAAAFLQRWNVGSDD
jgi:hypothetical protein